MPVEFTRHGLRDLENLDDGTYTAILAALDRVANGDHHNVRKLVGDPGSYRLRVGRWRARFVLAPDNTVIVDEITQRKDAYRD
jgi:mRNA-degrading endonuclease RelE of RelBE toxin-antitoxin system